MNGWLIAAAILSALTCALHVVLGGREAARPLLAVAGLGRLARFTNYYCWHLVTIALAQMAAAFGYAARAGAAPDLAMLATVTALLFGAWSLIMIAAYRLPPLAFPQWALFLPISLLGLAGILS